MKNFRRLTAATALASVAVVLVFTGPASSSGATIKVAPTLAGCTGASPADFTTIQAGVSAATPGDTVLVCPGIYDEHVSITTNGITVVGVNNPLGKNKNKKKKSGSSTSCSSLGGLSSSSMAILQPSTAGDGITVTANDVGIDQLAFRVQDAASIDLVTDSSHSGTQVNKNVFWQIPNTGIELDSNGTDLTDIEKNCFVGLPGSTLAAIGNSTSLSNAKIASNSFTKNYVDASGLTGAIVLNPSGTTDHVKIKQNESMNDGLFLMVQATTNVTVDSNTVTNSNNASIFVGGGNSLLNVKSNSISSGHEEGLLFDPNGGSASSFVAVKDNKITSAGLTGIDIIDNGLATSLLQSNTITNGSVDGLRISGTGNSGLMITSNTLQRNAVHDCHDSSTGSGSGGTANLWTDNVGDVQNRDDLCDGADTNTAGP